ncbi:hypothetical protein PVAP13_3KG119427 [Panicum virgatum]|uniref:Uncharacterized protein n=1 Tax=Panicum virgatum TaxID=38727 RepID=A0A8T0UVX2_PANVG|nr:hypothetical protein PVAP13_3KG119427 [Panicum virgatum]
MAGGVLPAAERADPAPVIADPAPSGPLGPAPSRSAGGVGGHRASRCCASGVASVPSRAPGFTSGPARVGVAGGAPSSSPHIAAAGAAGDRAPATLVACGGGSSLSPRVTLPSTQRATDAGCRPCSLWPDPVPPLLRIRWMPRRWWLAAGRVVGPSPSISGPSPGLLQRGQAGAGGDLHRGGRQSGALRAARLPGCRQKLRAGPACPVGMKILRVLLTTTVASADATFLREGVVGALQLPGPGSIFLCSGHRFSLPKP